MRVFRRTVQQPDAFAGRLSDSQQGALEALRDDGIVALPFERLIDDEGLWQALASDMQQWVERAKSRVRIDLDAPKAKEDFLIRRYRPGKGDGATTVEEARLATSSPWLRFALDSGVLDVVNTYRGQATKLVDHDQWYTVPFAGDHDRVSSQQWHRDPEDRHVVKVFVYFSDVDLGGGPFQYVRGSAEGGRYGDLWPWGEAEWYPPQEEFEAKIPAAEHLTVTGPRGTVIICDTSGFHRGGFAETVPRLLSYHTFVSSQAAYERKFAVDWASDADGLTQRAKYALS
jgi:hypothetical protein